MRIIGSLVCSFLLCTVGYSDTIFVPDDFSSIQDAIDASASGDTIVVRPGTYVENIGFKGKDVHLVSEMGPDHTMIDGNQSGSVVLFENGEDHDSILEGFTITNGTGHEYEDYLNGGGIFCMLGASPTIKNNHLSDNTAYFGGGIACYDGASPIISNNVISGNTAKVVDGYGGGISCRYQSNPVIDSNIIEDNLASYFGGGIYCSWQSHPVISNNFIVDNKATHDYWGRGAGIFYVSPQVSVELTIRNNTIVRNKAVRGGGIYCWYGVTLNAVNTIIRNNNAQSGDDVYLDTHFVSQPCTLNISYSVLKHEAGKTFVEEGSSINLGEGMIDENPLFADPVQGDFHLTWLSPCVNRGMNLNMELEDIDGDPRCHMGTTDMGADEFTGVHPFEATEFTIPESQGGAVEFSLHGGLLNHGRTYLVLGSLSGTAPGFPLPGGRISLPLNVDSFTGMVRANLNTPFFVDFLASLNPFGNGSAVLDTHGPLPGSAGVVMSFAFLLAGPDFDFVSNPINIEVVD